MKQFAKILGFVLAVYLPLFAQCDTWTTSTIRNCNNYDYELWNQNNSGTVEMKINGNSTAGGTFTAKWSGTENVLFRAGKKWGSSSTTTVASLGNAVLEFDATWSSGDNVKMLGVYGWAYYPSGSIPTKRENGNNATFSDQIEYYIIQDRGSYNPATNSDLCKSTPYGEGTIDGVLYEFRVCDRIGQAMLTGNGNFKQYFSIPKNTSSHKTKGTITVSKHFSEWERVGMKMSNCRLYEIAMKVESYTGASKNSSGNATVTKNLLTIGGSLPSSTSGGVTTPSSSSQAKVQATTCKTPLITYPPSSVPSDPYTACFKHSNNKCYVCKVSSEGEHEGNMNTCASSWVWEGSQLESNLTSGYWYQEVDCPGSTSSTSSNTASSSSMYSSSSAPALSSTAVSSSSSRPSNNSSSSAVTTFILNNAPLMHFSVRANGKELLVEASVPATVKIYDIKGQKMASFNVSSKLTSIDVSSMSGGVYYAKVYGVPDQKIRFILK